MTYTEEEMLPWYVNLYRNDKSILIHLTETFVARYCIIKIYNLLVACEKLTPIENVPRETKIELLNECRGAKDLIQACKILWTLKYYL